MPGWSASPRTGVVSGSSTRSSRSSTRLAVPSASFEYADTNYNLLGLVIEHVRQRPLVDVLRDGVLRVEGTERLIYQPDEAPTDPMAMPRGESRDALEQGGGYLPSISDTIDGAAGGMASDSISLARWWRAFCAGEIVSEASLTEMSTFYDNVERSCHRLRARAVQSRGRVRAGRRAHGSELRLQLVGRVPDRGPLDRRRADQLRMPASSIWADRWSWRRARNDLMGVGRRGGQLARPTRGPGSAAPP